jgi:hypothetical protein
VLAAQPLAQHEGVLGADRDDEREAEQEAGADGEQEGVHTTILRPAAAEAQRTSLQQH